MLDRLALVMLVLCWCLVAGCRHAALPPDHATAIDLAVFTDPASSVRSRAIEDAVASAVAPAGGSSVQSEVGPGPGAEEVDDDLEPVEDEAQRTLVPPLAPGDPVLVDSLVGQVNGRPIFANDFFEPLADRLIALADETPTRGAFRRQSAPIVMDELRQVVINALFLAEAESQLTFDQQKGLRSWLRQVEEQVIAGYGGSKARAQRILAAEGKTLETHMESLKDRALIQQLIQDRIEPRIIVSWRDIEREYRRRETEFNPPAKITLARIRLATEREADGIDDVSRRLAAGEPFLEVAEDVGPRSSGIWQTFDIDGGNPGDIEFANETLQAAIKTLRGEGDTTSPFEMGRFTWWVNVHEVEQPPGRDLYDPSVQRQLATQLRRERGSEAQNRYISGLLERGIYDELDDMASRLIDISVARYGPR